MDDEIVFAAVRGPVAALQRNELLGRGGMGAVFRATVIDADLLGDSVQPFVRQLAPHLSHDHEDLRALEGRIRANILEILEETRSVVVKIAHNTTQHQQTVASRSRAHGLAWREIKRQLEQQEGMPHSPRVLGGQLDGEPVYFLQSYHAGYNLQDLMGTPEATKGGVGLQMRMALLAHAARNILQTEQVGLVHRDIKPSNFLLDERGDVLTLDFGLARKVSDESMAMTQEGEALGTAQYVAPEVSRGQMHITAKADVFSFGLMAAEMLTGRCPYKGANNAQTLLKRTMLEPGVEPELVTFDHVADMHSEDRSFIEEALAPMLTRMIHPDPRKRPDPLEVAEFFHGHSYLPGRISFAEFIDPSTRNGSLYLPQEATGRKQSGEEGRRFETPADMREALLKGAAERASQYNFLQYGSASARRVTRSVHTNVMRNRALVGTAVGAALLVGSTATYWGFSGGRQEEHEPAVVKPDDAPNAPVTVQKPVTEIVQEMPETIDQGGEVSMLVQDGELKGIRLFEDDSVVLDMDLIPCYSMGDDGPELTGAMAICSPNQIRQMLRLPEDAALPEEDRNGQVVQLVQTRDGRSKFCAVSGIFTLIEHEGKRYVYTSRGDFLAARFPDLDEGQSGHTRELVSEVPLEALESIPAITGAEGEIPSYWPEAMQQYSPLQIMNMPLDMFKHGMREAHQL